jgi:predicted GH43/DUF377 family glycosyl hydrolase
MLMALIGSALWSQSISAQERVDKAANLKRHTWLRDPRNPIFVPQSSFDKRGSQGPFVVPHDGRWWMFYAGIGTDGVQRICLATALADKPTEWERLGPVVELGGKDAFDERGATYPCVHRVGNKWHLYYSGRSSRSGPQHFSAYWGIGLAQSDDLRNWKKYSTQPVLQGDGIKEYPKNQALVGLGNILEIPQPDGRVLYRLYYTLLPGLKSKEWHVIEHKVGVVAHSFDGVNWTDRRIVLERRRSVNTEDIGIVGMQVWKTRTRYRATYTGLGTKHKSYSLAEAVSTDGLTWDRGVSQDNVSLAPRPGTWERKMIGYPHVLSEGDSLRIFYNGTGGGGTGIGMAVAKMLD